MSTSIHTRLWYKRDLNFNLARTTTAIVTYILWQRRLWYGITAPFLPFCLRHIYFQSNIFIISSLSFIYRVRVYIYINTILYGNNSLLLHMPIQYTFIISKWIVFKFFSPCTYYLKYLFLMANNNQWIIKYYLFCIFMYEYLKRLPCVRKKRE